MPPSTPCPLLFEINTRCWLHELSNQSGRSISLATVPDSEFARWRQLGFTHIWLMGVWTTGQKSQAKALLEHQTKTLDPMHAPIAGSPYAIAQYRVADALGGDPGLRAFRNKLHAAGLKLILDFVPNHVGLDHPWLQQYPERFVQNSIAAPGTFAQPSRLGPRWIAHGRDPFFPPWSDTAQLDYRQPATQAAMLETLQSVAARCDGVRCDMAMLVLNDVFEKTWSNMPPCNLDPDATPPASPNFWQSAIPAIRKNFPDFVFLAEVYWGLEPRLQSLGFDYTYDKELYDALVRGDPARVQKRLLHSTPEFIQSSAHFLENHDEPRIASILSPAPHRAAALLILALPGMRFLHDGQLSGARIKVPVQLQSRPAEPTNPEIQHTYNELLSILPQTAIGRGNAQILTPLNAWPENTSAQNISLVQWQIHPPDFDLAVVSLGPGQSQCYAPLNIAGLDHNDWSMKDLLGTEYYRRPGKDLQQRGLYLDIPGYAAQLYHFSPA